MNISKLSERCSGNLGEDSEISERCPGNLGENSEISEESQGRPDSLGEFSEISEGHIGMPRDIYYCLKYPRIGGVSPGNLGKPRIPRQPGQPKDPQDCFRIIESDLG